MKIKKIQYNPCSLKLNQKFCNSKTQYSIKENILIEIITGSISGYGEISPLEKFSTETTQEIQWGLEAFIQAIDYDADYSLNDLLILADIHCNEIPSLHFGIDTALYDIESKKNKVSLSKLLSSRSYDYIKFSSLYSNQSKKIQYKTKTIKYKLGVQSIDEDMQVLESIANNNKSIKFRFDANRCYTFEEFLEVYKKLKIFNIDYFEEPIQNPSLEKLKKIKNELDCKIAIDESLYDGSDYNLWINEKIIHAIIIKPSILGGYKKILRLSQMAQKNNLRVILSSSLENHIGNMATIHLAATLENNEEHGLDIYNFYDTVINKSVYQKNTFDINLKSLIGLGI